MIATHKAKASDLWGVGYGPNDRRRGPAAQARRAAKRAAKRARVTLKAWLRMNGGKS